MTTVRLQWIILMNTSHSLVVHKNGLLVLIRHYLVISLYILAMKSDLSRIGTSINNRYI